MTVDDAYDEIVRRHGPPPDYAGRARKAWFDKHRQLMLDLCAGREQPQTQGVLTEPGIDQEGGT